MSHWWMSVPISHLDERLVDESRVTCLSSAEKSGGGRARGSRGANVSCQRITGFCEWSGVEERIERIVNVNIKLKRTQLLFVCCLFITSSPLSVRECFFAFVFQLDSVMPGRPTDLPITLIVCRFQSNLYVLTSTAMVPFIEEIQI